MGKNLLSFLSFFKIGKSKNQKKEEQPTVVSSSLQRNPSQEESVPQKLSEAHSFDVHPPMYLRAINALAIGLGTIPYELKFTTDRKLAVWFITVRVNISLSRFYYVNIILHPSLAEKKVITMNDSNQRDIKISEDYLLNEFESLVEEVSEAYQSRLKGHRAEKRFKQLFETYLRDSGKKNYLVSYASTSAGQQGVNISVDDPKAKQKSFYFQVKSSETEEETRFYRNEKIHKIIVNDSIPDKNIREQIKRIITSL